MVKTALERLEGVKQANVTFDPPRAVVKFDEEKVELTSLISAVEEAGFKAKFLSK